MDSGFDSENEREDVPKFHSEENESYESALETRKDENVRNLRSRNVESDEKHGLETEGEDDEIYFHNLTETKQIPETPGDQRDYLIDWIGAKDADHPLNWSTRRKLQALIVCSLTATVTAFGSAIVSTSSQGIMKEFHVGLTVAELNTTLFVLGFAVGPVCWGPLSENVGRRIPQLIGIFGLTVFSFAGATGKDLQTIIISRFFGGVFGSSSIAVSPAIPADVFAAKYRGMGISVVSLTICAGPMLAPVVGGYIVNSYLGWRWTFYILGIAASLVLVLIAFFLPESYPPKLLQQRAQRVREKTGNWAVQAPLEISGLDTSQIVERTLTKPFKMLTVEPILLLVSLYHGFIYGILYLCLSAVPLVFSSYGWKGGNIYLPYLGMFIGAFLVINVNIFVFEKIYAKKLEERGGKVVPEDRLPLMMMCGVIFVIGIFMFTWSGAYHVFWFVPVLGCVFIGFGLIGLFLPAFSYIIDTYLALAASALAANTFVRSGMGCAFPLFASQMFKNLGTQWAGTLIGCLAALLAPVPFLFYVFGKKIRQKSQYAFDMEALEVKLTRHATHGSIHRA